MRSAFQPFDQVDAIRCGGYLASRVMFTERRTEYAVGPGYCESNRFRPVRANVRLAIRGFRFELLPEFGASFCQRLFP